MNQSQGEQEKVNHTGSKSVQVSLPNWLVQSIPWTLCIGAVIAAVFMVIQLNERFRWFEFSGKRVHRIAVVDVDAVLDVYKKEFVVAMSPPKISDQEREQANDAVRRASVAVGVSVKAIAAECQCVLLVRTALFNPEVVDDYTEPLAQKTAALLKRAQAPNGELK